MASFEAAVRGSFFAPRFQFYFAHVGFYRTLSLAVDSSLVSGVESRSKVCNYLFVWLNINFWVVGRFGYGDHK